MADSLIACRGLDPRDLMDRFTAWGGAYSCTGTCFDIGLITREALARYAVNGDPFAGTSAPDTAGNGSLMRLAPVALFALDDPALADRLARDQSCTTHGAPQAVQACAFFVQLTREAIRGEVDVLRPRPWAGNPAIAALAGGAWRSKAREEIRSSGYVVHTLEAALWCVGTTNSFEAALIMAVNLGEDADTVGAVTGQLAGVLYGMSAIPAAWREPLTWQERIVAMVDHLHIEAVRP